MSAVLVGNWNYPTRIWAGPGRIAELPIACAELGIRRPLLVTDSGLRDSAMVRSALARLTNAALHADVRSNPVAADLAAGLAAYRAGAHDGVIAFGVRAAAAAVGLRGR
jgi:alcohol dehydrogenase class IV